MSYLNKNFRLLLIAAFCFLVNCERQPNFFRYGDFFPRKSANDARVSESLTSGAIRDVIKRNSPRFRKVLVRNSDPNILFEANDFRLMTSRAKQKLDTLAGLVSSRLSKDVKIKVLKAWTDVVDNNDILSLHYEGRAFLIQASNNNKDLLNDLMLLAIEAGFDWVYFKNVDSIYLSVIPDVCQTKLDLSITVDTSGSVGFANFERVKKFLSNLIEFFNVGLDETRIALVSYSYSVNVEFRLNEKQNKQLMKDAINKIVYQRSITATGDALMTLVKYIYTEKNGMRVDKSIPKIGILMTDGYSNGDYNVHSAAEHVKEAGINMFVVGVTDSVQMSEVESIATPPWKEHYFSIKSFTDLSSFVDQISAVSCDEGAQLSQCENAETAVDGGSFKYFQSKFTGSTQRVTVEVFDKKGISFVFISTKLRNPGPLSEAKDVTKSNSKISPRTVTIDLPPNEKILYIAIQGQQDTNVFVLSIWDSLFSIDQITKTIPENEDAGLLVATVQTKTNPKSFNYKIKDDLYKEYFQINMSNGEIRTTQRLDREFISSYQLSVIAEDQNDKCHKSLMSIVIYIDDKNDNEPIFEKSNYTVELREDTPLNQLVIQVRATDKDIGKNAELSYEIYGENQDILKIEKETGIIRTNKYLDFETNSTYTVLLKVRDFGSNVNFGYATLMVVVTDVNEPPEFTNCKIPRSCVLKIDENQPENTTVSTLSAKDPDTKQLCTLNYNIISLDKQYFKIFNNMIMTRMPLDREKKESYLLEVAVSDCGKPPLFAYTSIVVILNDLNDNSPKFFDSSYQCIAKEDLSPKSQLCAVRATDIDAGNNATIIFSIFSSDDEGIASIDSNTGQLTLQRKLDRETKATINLVINAADQGTPSLSSSVNLTIVVIDVNDNAPTFAGNMNLSIDENVFIRTFVTELQANDKDEGLNAQVRFSIVSGNIDNMFGINNKGELITLKIPDREEQELFTLKLMVQDLGVPPLSTTATYTIKINDLNDNSPVFEKIRYNVMVKENTIKNSPVTKVSATDKDIGINKELTYEIISGNQQNVFSLDKDFGNLTLASALNFGKQRNYILNIVATDKGSPSRKGEAFVHITVEDTNDFTPTFIGLPYHKSLNENENTGTSVLLISASDGDFGPSGELTYSIQENLPFIINPQTGLITTKSQIDYEVNQSFFFMVYVKDAGTPSLQANASVSVSIIDVNDNTPFMVNQIVFVIENEVVDKTILNLTGIDKDSGSNSLIEYSLKSASVPFKILQEELKVSGDLDRETVDQYNLTIQLKDRGTPSLTSLSKITVIVNDANDNDPKFGKSVYNCSVLENSHFGSQVCFVDATDADTGENAKLSFFLNDSSVFLIDKISGEIRTNASLDREVKDNYLATIVVKDNGVNQRESKALLSVKILDENDNQPKFKMSSYNFNFQEEQVDGTIIGNIFATDEDIGSNKEIVFNVMDNNRFWVDNQVNQGILKAKRLNREEKDLYKFRIKATDKGTPSLSSEVNVVVAVTDINDNKPLIETKTYQRSIKETVANGTFVVKISASDLDIDKNGVFSYRIKSGINSDHFYIDHKTGVITTAANLDYETITSYLLTIETKDEGSPPLSDETIVNITIINEDDTAPKFEEVKNVSIYEDLGVNQPVLQFKATDADGSEIRYKIEGGNTDNTFVINSETGLLSLKNNLDREKIDFYNISVNASDTNKHNVIYVPVIVLDVNDNYPQFNQVSYNGTVVEESDDFTKVIVSVNATDRDLEENGEVEYSIVSDNKDVFGIDLKSGIIYPKKKLDREVVDSYRVEVAASDKGTPSLYSTVYVTINVEDINDNSPKFENTTYNITIDENSGTNITIAQLTAYDADKDENGRITYKITEDATRSFVINETSGLLSTAIDFDKEKEDLYLVEITASDHGELVKSSVAKVSVLVLDVNDNAPVIQTKTFPPINESVTIETKVNVIKASDADKDDINKNLVFTITPDTFRIESNGDVFLNRALDRELVSEYTVKVRVEDTGLPRLYTSMQYTVSVTDDNDNAPEFLSSYSAQLEENISSKQKLFTVQAKDIDIGINSKVTYGIIDNYKGVFSIDPVSGNLYAVKPVDYEIHKSFTLNISASDWRFTTFTTAKIDVINLNDNSPQFKKTEYSSCISESEPINKFVLEASAIDLDPFGELSYSIITTDLGLPFTIESKTGRIIVSDILDREKSDNYSFKVTAFDGGNPKMFNETNVLITILDVNDNPPKFTTYSEVVFVKENQPIGTLVSKIKAFDDDLGENATVRYEAVSNTRDLNIDIVTGEIKTSRVFDREAAESSIIFTYVAYDLGDPKLVSENRTITLDIEDENDNSPMWLKNYSVSVLEDHATNSQIFVVEAIDIDLGQNAVVTYYIKESSTFQIDQSSGAISLKTSLDRETISAYNLTVFARDNGSVSLENYTTVAITVLDVNDNNPVFIESSLHAQISENTKGENDLVLIQATDQDIGSNAQIIYSLRHDLFSIHPITGQVKVLRSLDREETDKYNITVVARDKGNPSLATEAVLKVDVLDVDDNCPVFASSFYKATIQENLPFGTPVLNVSATDSDFGENAQLNYGIMESNDRGAFTIDAHSGCITVAKSDKVDREFSEVYHLLVKAGSTSCGFSSGDTDTGDGGKPAENNFTLAYVSITITDLNDNAPVILNDYQKIDYKNITTEEIIIVNATDKDLGKGGEVEFRIIRVDQKTVSNYVENHVLIEVSDKGDTPLATNATFIVVNIIECDVMYFSIDEVGRLTVNSLCSVVNRKSNEPVLVGSFVNLSCVATGNSPVFYRWSKDGSVISGWSEDPNLSLSAVKHDYEGLYACIASNKAGVLQSSTTKLIVYEKPSIVKQPTSVTVGETEHALFKIQASAVPAPKYQWYKNDLPIKGATKEDFMLESTIPADSAKYFCKITNDVGEVHSEKVYLTVVSRESLVALNVKILTENKKSNCFDFFTEDFEEQAKIVLNRPMIVTNIQNIDDKAKLCNRTACSKNPCQNKGVCEATDTGFQCICTSSWKGKTCEENINECVQDFFVCYDGVCNDLNGSFSCDCPEKMSGHRCQYNSTACQNNTCQGGICVPSENNLFNCINNSDVITLIAKPIANWNELQTQYDLELSLNRIIKTTVTSVSTHSNRIRKDTSVVDFGLCTVHVTGHVLENSESKISFVLDCSVDQLNKTIEFTPDVVKELCLQLLNSDDVFSQCGRLGNMEKSKVTTEAPLNVLVYAVIKDSRNKTISADETIKIMKEKNFASLLANYQVTNFRNVYEKKNAEAQKSHFSVIIASATCAVVLLILIVFFVYRRRSQTQGNDKQSSIMHQRSMMIHDTSTSVLLPSSTCKKNMAFNDDNDDVKDGSTFMFEMPSDLISGKK